MTLLATEIHNHNDPDHAVILFAADRRISIKGKFKDSRKKIFNLPWLNGGIGYFGIAELPGPRGLGPMQLWLEAFIRRTAGIGTLEEFSRKLASDLNRVVPKSWHKTERSGFHIAGFSAAGKPEFWFVRNIGDTGAPTLGRYEAREEFQRRDALKLPRGVAQIYRNGDLRAHEAAWGRLDESFGQLLTLPDFRTLRTAEDYEKWVAFKMEVIAYFYKKYHPKPVIARPIDTILIKPRRIRRRSP